MLALPFRMLLPHRAAISVKERLDPAPHHLNAHCCGSFAYSYEAVALRGLQDHIRTQ